MFYYPTLLPRVQISRETSTNNRYLYLSHSSRPCEVQNLGKSEFGEFLVVCILTRPTGSSKYYTTRKNIQRYCTPKRLIRYIYYPTLLSRACTNNARNEYNYLYSSHSSRPREVQNLGKSEFEEKKSLDNKSLIRRFGV